MRSNDDRRFRIEFMTASNRRSGIQLLHPSHSDLFSRFARGHSGFLFRWLLALSNCGLRTWGKTQSDRAAVSAGFRLEQIPGHGIFRARLAHMRGYPPFDFGHWLREFRRMLVALFYCF